jgi:hypothetical protein
MVCSLVRLFVIYFLFLFVVNMDDCWQRSRDANGIIQADPTDFPSGVPALVDYVHSKKLKFGLYSGTIIIFINLSIDLSSYYFSLYVRCWKQNMRWPTWFIAL